MKTLLNITCIIGACGIAGCGEAPTESSPIERAVIATAAEENVRLEILATSKEAETGEPIELIITLEAPPRERAELVLPADDRLGSFDILRIEDARTGLEDLKIAPRQRILVSTLESGAIQLPSIEAHYGTDSILRTEPADFMIESLIEGEFDPSDFADIRPAVDDTLDSERPDWVMPTVIGGSAVVVIGLAIALGLLSRRRHRPRVPHEWALAELDRIEAEGPAPDDRTTDRFERIEGVVRWYMAFRFDIDAPDRTSNELIEAVLEHHAINDDARVILERIVRESDRVKFAGGRVSSEECRIALGSARLFVQQTMSTTSEEAA
jgi:hypothetical protein